jgi:histidinol-phosphate aminotransferase
MNDSIPREPAAWQSPRLAGLAPPLRAGSAPPGVAARARLHLNESPWGPSQRAIAAAAEAAAGVNRYPPGEGGPLVDALAARSGAAPGRIVLAAGSDLVLHYACMIALAPARSCVFPRPSFPRYRLSTAIAGARPIPVEVGPDGANDVAAMLAAITADTTLVFACTPNGNTGGMLGEAALTALARGVPDTVLLCIDEAYAEFGRAAGGPDAAAILSANRTGPWIVSRTFSKAFALAGARLGYGICSGEDVVAAIGAMRPIFEVSAMSVAMALAALDDAAHLATIIDGTAAGREQLAAGFRRLGFAPWPSFANFVSADLGRPAEPVIAAMAARGVLARGFREPVGHDTALRISVGTAEENALALDTLAASLAANARTAEETLA